MAIQASSSEMSATSTAILRRGKRIVNALKVRKLALALESVTEGILITNAVMETRAS